jgi:hypothetical protein
LKAAGGTGDADVDVVAMARAAGETGPARNELLAHRWVAAS